MSHGMFNMVHVPSLFMMLKGGGGGGGTDKWLGRQMIRKKEFLLPNFWSEIKQIKHSTTTHKITHTPPLKAVNVRTDFCKKNKRFDLVCLGPVLTL